MTTNIKFIKEELYPGSQFEQFIERVKRDISEAEQYNTRDAKSKVIRLRGFLQELQGAR